MVHDCVSTSIGGIVGRDLRKVTCTVKIGQKRNAFNAKDDMVFMIYFV